MQSGQTNHFTYWLQSVSLCVYMCFSIKAVQNYKILI